jgi:uncharacterized protein YcgI (DUF1989 family)
LSHGAQIVNLFAFNLDDPDERMWHETLIREGIFLTRFYRIWGTMARYRPLLTVLEDTVTSSPNATYGQHHPYYGGSGTPSDWHYAGGAPGVKTTWDQFADLMVERGVDRSLLLENVCLFQKSTVDPVPQRILILPSDAIASDSVTLFAEIDLCVLLALSPYLDGSRAASELGRPEPLPVEVRITDKLRDPLPWPYPGISYPDMRLYLNERGVRTDQPGVTAGIDYRVDPQASAPAPTTSAGSPAAAHGKHKGR